ncbi:MAG: anti-sigma factor [Ardenticatenales bacterium]|nr:anti-sigma factor [Ardenticatenales bacterium]
MSEELTYEQVVEQVSDYVLGDLEPEEMMEMDAYFQKQRTLLALLRETEETLAQFAHSAPDVPLPRDAKERLMMRVHADQKQGARRAMSRLHLTTKTVWQMGAAAAAILLMALSFYTSQLQGQVAQLQLERDMLQRVRQEQLRVLAGARQAVILPGTEAAPAAYGTFYRNGQEALILFEGLAALPDDQSYQLWLIPAEGDPVPAGLLTVKEGAPGVQTISIPVGAQDFAAVGVSVEPAGGSPAPTGPIVLLGKSG